MRSIESVIFFGSPSESKVDVVCGQLGFEMAGFSMHVSCQRKNFLSRRTPVPSTRE
jgi:hypothetical protein